MPPSTTPPASPRPRLSLCMIVRNERDHLPNCLLSAQGLVDEIIVVDTGSTDGTQEIARAHGAEVVQTEWRRNFSHARNLGLERARGAWILVLDADESLPTASREQIRALIQRPPQEAFNLVTRNVEVSGQLIRGEILRLFPNRPEIRFEFPLHEEVNPSLAQAGIPIRNTDIEIAHSGYADAATLAQKLRRNQEIIAEALAVKPPLRTELHLRYYYAGACYDAQDWARAAAEFEWCQEHAPAGYARLNAISRLRAGECHFLTGNLVRARASLPSEPDVGLHPAALSLGAQIAAGRADSADARRWYEVLLAVPDGAFVPLVSLGVLKYKALVFLGNFWAGQGRKDAGVKLLRLALEIQNRTCRDIGTDLAVQYRRIIRPPGTPPG
jgi:hypothetical protein